LGSATIITGLLSLNTDPLSPLPTHQRNGNSVARTEGLDLSSKFIGHISFNVFRVNRISANITPDEVGGNHFFPTAPEQVLEFHSLLGTNPPAITASGTEDDVVENGSFFSFVCITQGVGRAVLHASQTAVAILINLKVRHVFSDLVKPAEYWALNSAVYVWVFWFVPHNGSKELTGCCLNLGQLHLVGPHETQCPGLAYPYASRIPPAKVALESSCPNRIEIHGPKRTGGKTHLATHTPLMIDGNSV
jgi:hypothetical protein